MDKIINKFNNLSLPTVILMASLVIGSFYYAGGVNKQKSIERQQELKIQEEKTKTDQVKQEREQAKQALDTCIASAEENYSDNWYRVCKSQGKLTNRCISLYDMTLEEYAKEKNIPDDKKFNAEEIKRRQDYARQLGWSEDEIQRGTFVEMAKTDYYKEKDDCLCLLPSDSTDRIDKKLQDNKDECFRKYPLN